VLELEVRGPPELDTRAFDELFVKRDGPSRRAQIVHRDPRRNREHPGTQVPPVLEPVVGPKCPQERLLPGILGALTDQATQVAENVARVLPVEPLEWRYGHRLHHEV